MASFLIQKYRITKSVWKKYYEDMECRIWLKIHFLHSDIQLNRKVMSDGHGERFHQYKEMEKKNYHDKWYLNRLGNFYGCSRAT